MKKIRSVTRYSHEWIFLSEQKNLDYRKNYKIKKNCDNFSKSLK